MESRIVCYRRMFVIWIVLILISLIPVPILATWSETAGKSQASHFNILSYDGPIQYERSNMEGANLLNSQTMGSNLFFKEHIRRKETDAMNFSMNHLFTNNSDFQRNQYTEVKPKGTLPATLAYNYTFTRAKNGKYWTGRYSWPYSVATGNQKQPLLKKLASENQLQYNFIASLKRDNHQNIHFHQGFNYTDDHAVVNLIDRDASYNTLGTTILSYENSKDDANRIFKTYGSEATKDWHPLEMKNYGLDVRFGTARSCGCGSSAVSEMSFAVADAKSPVISKITVSSDPSGTKPKTYFMKGNLGYIHLKFNEDIRLADDGKNMPQFRDVELGLSLVSLVNNSSEGAPNFNATLIAVKKDTMTFQFEVPEILSTKNKNGEILSSVTANHKIIGVMPTQQWVNKIGDRSFPYVILKGDNNVLALGEGSQKEKDLTHTSSLVTDLAGNPVNWAASARAIPEFVIDSEKPAIASLDLSGSMISQDSYKTLENGQWPADIDRGAVFAGGNDRFYAEVSISEELVPLTEVQLEATVATFNLTGGNGPVTARAVSSYVTSNGTRSITKIIFDWVSTNATPPSAPAPIKVTEITFGGGITDLAGNAIVQPMASDIPVPKQQLWIDTELPTIKLGTKLNETNNGYEPLRYDSQDPNAFYIPIEVSDQGNFGNPMYTSELDNLIGHFGLSMDASWLPYDKVATMSPEKPKSYGGGTFTLIKDQTVYLHFQLLEGVPYDFTSTKVLVEISDYARNRRAQAIQISQKADGAGPNISFRNLEKTYNNEENRGEISVGVSIQDNSSNLANVKYQWTAGNAAVPEEEWINDTSLNEGEGSDHMVTLSAIAFDGEKTERRLWIKAEDTAGNVSIRSYYVLYDLEKPAYSYKLGFEANAMIGNSHNTPGNLRHPIYVYNPPLYSGDDLTITKAAATTIFMIEDRISEEEGDYFVRTFTSRANGTGDSDVTYNDLVYSTSTNEGNKQYDRWYHVTYGGSEDYYTFADATAVDSKPGLQTRLDQQWLSYYGIQNVILLTALGDHSELGGSEGFYEIEGPYVSIEELFFNSASYPVNSAQSDKVPHTVEFAKPLAPDGTPIDLSMGSKDYEPGNSGSATRYVKSLDGVRFPFTIKNRYEPEWGVADVDFTGGSPKDGQSDWIGTVGSYAELIYLGYTPEANDEAGLGNEDVFCGRFDLIPGQAEQILTIPQGMATKSGYYRIDITLSVLGAGKNNNNSRAQPMETHVSLGDIFLYVEEPDSFGMWDYSISSSYKGLNVHTIARETTGPPEGYYYTDVKLGSYEEEYVSKEQLLDFQLQGLPSYLDRGIGKPNYWEDLTKVYWQIWNADDPEGETNARWGTFHSIYGAMVKLVDTIKAEDYEPSESLTGTYTTIPILKGKEKNTILYRFALQNGYTSPVRQINAYVRGEAPVVEANFSPEKPTDGSLVNGVTATFEEAYSPNGAILTYALFQELDRIGDFVQEKWKAGEPFAAELTETGTYDLVVFDEFGNVAADRQTIDYVDGEAPLLFFEKKQGNIENEFHYEITLKDNRPISGTKLFIVQSDEVSSDKSEVNVWEGEVPILYNGAEWYANSPQQSGVYYSKVTSPSKVNEYDNYYSMTMEIKGVYPYMEEKDEDVSVRRYVSFYCVDDMGNTDTATTDSEIGFIPNVKPAFVDSSYDQQRGLQLDFNTPVYANGISRYGRTLTGLPIYSNGVYTLDYKDIFGRPYSETVEIRGMGEFSLFAELSETMPTNQNVEVFLSTGEDEKSVIKQVAAEMPEKIQISLADDGKTGNVTVLENTTLEVEVEREGGTRIFQIPVTNIDRELSRAKAVFQYTAGNPLPGQRETPGDIIVGLECEEEIMGVDGSPLVYTFMLGGPTTHTFQYRDVAGNIGSLEVICPMTIVDSQEGNPNVAPDYSVEVQQKISSVFNTYEAFSDEEVTVSGAAIWSSLEPAQGYRLIFSSQRQGAKLFVTEPSGQEPDYTTGQNAVIKNVSVSGRTITVSDNSEFTVWMVDRFGNAASVPVTITSIDNSKPEAAVEYEKIEGGKIINAYLIPSGSGITVTNKTGVLLQMAGKYEDKYYHKFTANGKFIFHIKNHVGTDGEILSQVSAFDTTAPSVIDVKWTGERERPTNRTITVQFTLAKNIRDVSAAWIDGGNQDDVTDHISMQISGNVVLVTYLENTEPFVLTFTAPNGVTSQYGANEGESLAVTNMDFTPPQLTGAAVVKLDEGKRAATISFGTNEPVFCAELMKYGESNTPIAAESFTATVVENGGYTFNLTDAAGNSKVVTVEVAEIDNTGLSLSYSLTKSDDEIYRYAYQLGELPIGTVVYVKPNKLCTSISLIERFNDDEEPVLSNDHKNVAANQWVSFAIEDGKDSYLIRAVDERGEEVSSFLSIMPPDTAPPVILLKQPTIAVQTGTSVGALEAALRDNLLVTDNRSSVGAITVTVNVGAVNLYEKGLYTAIVKAEDEAGNESPETKEAVRVYGSDDLYVLIGDEAVFPGGTVIVKQPQISMAVKNLMGGEPYIVKYKAGMKTTAQMKIGAQNGIVDTQGFTQLSLQENKYYTVYIRSQSRKELLFYVFVGN